MKRLFFAVALAAVLAGCGDPPPLPVCKFQPGDMVESVLSGDRGQVIWVERYYCLYNVRFPAQAMTLTKDGGFLRGAKGPVLPAPLVTIDRMREYELKEVQKITDAPGGK